MATVPASLAFNLLHELAQRPWEVSALRRQHTCLVTDTCPGHHRPLDRPVLGRIKSPEGLVQVLDSLPDVLWRRVALMRLGR